MVDRKKQFDLLKEIVMSTAPLNFIHMHMHNILPLF